MLFMGRRKFHTVCSKIEQDRRLALLIEVLSLKRDVEVQHVREEPPLCQFSITYDKIEGMWEFVQSFLG